MIHVIHTPTGWKVCQDYPEKLSYPCLDCTKMDCDAAKCTEKYDDAVALSIANAVDVREEDQNLVWKTLRKELWQIVPNLVYTLPELEMEIGNEHRLKKGDPMWKSNVLAHVFRKKEEQAGRPEDFPWPAKEEPKMEESQEDLIDEIIDIVKETSGHCHQQLKSKFHLTRVKAELKGEKK